MPRTLDDLLVPVQPDAVYTLAQLSRVLRVGITIIREAIRRGKLRHTERDGQRLVRGEWVVRWIAGEETRARRKSK